jgi:hypothetical protein
MHRLCWFGALSVLGLIMALHGEARSEHVLRVTFDVGGERFQAVVKNPDAVEYVLGFTAGSKPQLVPYGRVSASDSMEVERFADEARPECNSVPSSIKGRSEYCPAHARIVRVEDCRAGSCAPVRGIYAGRSPAA